MIDRAILPNNQEVTMPKSKTNSTKKRDLLSDSEDFKFLLAKMQALIPGLKPSPTDVLRYGLGLAVASLK